MIDGYLLQLKPSTLELGGHPDHHNLPDGCQDDWSHHHQSGFSMRFPKICDRWVFLAIESIKNILEIGGHPDHPDLPDHQSGIYPRFPKIYDTWVFVAIKAIKNILELGEHP